MSKENRNTSSRCTTCDEELLFESPNMADWPVKLDGVGYLCPLCFDIVDSILSDTGDLLNEEVNTHDHHNNHDAGG